MEPTETQNVHYETGVKVIGMDDEAYPSALKKLAEPPRVIYARGNLKLLDEKHHTAITGSEKASMKGMDVAIGLSNILSARGHVIVSGLGKGCDTGAHLGCLGACGKSIAVLPSPVTEIVPEENTHLADKILQGGGLLISASEHGSDVTDEGRRIAGEMLAALCEGMIIVESFSDEQILMDTVSDAVKMCRSVGAYRHPGGFDMTETSEGNEHLIMDMGAMPIRNIKDAEKFADVLEEKGRDE